VSAQRFPFLGSDGIGKGRRLLVYRPASIARASVKFTQRVDPLFVVTWTQPAPATAVTVRFSVTPSFQVIEYRPRALMKLGGAIHTTG